MFALGFCQQALGIARWIVLARLLGPHSFGLLGIAMLVMAVLRQFTTTGIQEAIIQKKDDVKGLLDTAWTIELIRGIILFTLLYLLAPFAVAFFDAPGKFAVNHFTKPTDLIIKLQKGKEPLSRYIYEKFPLSTQQLLKKYDESEPPPEMLLEALVHEFNEIIEGVSIYDKERFANVNISTYARKLIEQSKDSSDHVRVNRLLLEEAFPYEIKKVILDRPMVTLVMQLLGISILLAAATNVGTIYFRKELEFNKQFFYQISGTITDVTIAITLACIYRNIWALVFGKLAGDLVRCLLSYVMHPYRPKLSLNIEKAKKLWQFGRHIFCFTILKFFCTQGDDVFLGKVLGATSLGFYQLAFRLGNMVTKEIGGRIAIVAFPAYSKLQDKTDKLRGGYFKAVQLTTTLTFPIAGGLIALAPEITSIVFGERWLPMVPALQILCLLGPLRSLQRMPVFMGMGRPDIETKLSILRLIIMVITIYPLTIKYGIAGTSLSVLIAALGVQPMGFYELQKLIDAKAKDVLKLLSFPVTATLIMMLCVFVTKGVIGDVGLISLLLLISLGVISYAICIFVMSKISTEYDATALIGDIIKEIRRF